MSTLTQARPIEGVRAGDVPARTDLLLHAILASSAIPLMNPPVQLGGGTLQPCVDGGVRDGLPLDQAVDIVDTELASAAGRKGVIAIGTGVPNPQTTRPLLPELAPAPFHLGADYPLVGIALRALALLVDEIAAAELRDMSRLAGRGLDSIAITPSFDVGAGAGKIDPGVVQINMAYGWMTAYDRLRQHRLGLSHEEYRRLWTTTNLIAQMRYRCWLLEREGTSFRHEFPLLLAHLNSLPGWTEINTEGLDLIAILGAMIPEGWTFKREALGNAR